MKILSCIVAAVFVAAPASAQTGQLADVSAHLRAVNTMTAAFTQTDKAGKTVNGRLSLKRPGKIRFQYQKGVPILVVGDGRALNFVDYSVKQVQTWPIRNTPLGILLDPRRDLSSVAKVLPSADRSIVLIEARDPKHPEYGRMTLAFTRVASAPGGLMLQGWSALDSQNNRTTIRLTNQQFNAPVSDRAFIWSDPRPQMRPK